MKSMNLTRFCVLALLAAAVPAAAGAQGVEAPRIPLRTALNEINALRAEYATAQNHRDVAAMTALYAPDAMLITSMGKEILGRKAIGEELAKDTASAPATFNSSSVKVVGHTAWDMGTITAGGSVQHYLVVLRRGLKDWLISSVAVVPESSGMVDSR